MPTMTRTPQHERSHVELMTVYGICKILGASLDIGRTFHDALNVLAAHLGLERAMKARLPMVVRCFITPS